MKILLDNEKVLMDCGNIVYAKAGENGLVECPYGEATHIWNLDKNLAYMNRDNELVETNVEIPEDAEGNYKYVDGAFVIHPERRMQNIIRQLEELDNKIKREVEDLYELTGVTPYTNTADIIAQKNSLREELKQLKNL